jgi:PEGA domain
MQVSECGRCFEQGDSKMKALGKTLAIAVFGGLLLPLAPAASAQRRVVIVEPVPIYYPYFHAYGYYGPYVRPEYTGYVKIDTHLKGDAIYVDGGYAGVTGKLKKFPLRPGNHDIVVKDAEGRAFYQERVAVLLGRTTKIKVG